MLKTLPFGALRTLEAVVRLRGFSRAAEELNVTQSAVSQHVKQLEDWLGARLLVRKGRSVEPTMAGERLALATRDSFASLSRVCDDMRDVSRTSLKGILVASPPGFAFLWLLPRLLRFAEQFPDHPVSLSTDPQSLDTISTEADAVISYGKGQAGAFYAEHLMSERMTPVCSPELAQNLTSIEDLKNNVILFDHLEDGSTLSNWDYWAREVGVTLPKFSRSRTLGQANLVIQAAIDGHGVAMGRSPLIQDAIAKGQLIQPFPQSVASPLGYWFLCPQSALEKKPVMRFLEWLRTEC